MGTLNVGHSHKRTEKLEFCSKVPTATFTRGFWSRSGSKLVAFTRGGTLDSNPDSDHLSHYYEGCDPDSNPYLGPGACVNAPHLYKGA